MASKKEIELMLLDLRERFFNHAKKPNKNIRTKGMMANNTILHKARFIQKGNGEILDLRSKD